VPTKRKSRFAGHEKGDPKGSPFLLLPSEIDSRSAGQWPERCTLILAAAPWPVSFHKVLIFLKKKLYRVKLDL